MPDTAAEKFAEKAIDKAAQLRRMALDYHQFPTPGKLCVQATKPMANQHDLALAYSPGVAAPCEEIVREVASLEIRNPFRRRQQQDNKTSVVL